MDILMENFYVKFVACKLRSDFYQFTHILLLYSWLPYWLSYPAFKDTLETCYKGN